MTRASRSLSARQQAIRFALLSLLSFAGYLGLTALLHEGFGLPSLAAVPVAMACMTLFNFLTLRLAIFHANDQPWLKQLAGFIASIAGFRAAEYAGFVLLHGLLGLPYLITYAGILATSSICKFLFLRHVLFAAPRPAATLTEPAP